MGRERSEHPTELELQILKVLWQKAPGRVRDIRADLAKRGRALAHTSVITILNIMVRKGYLKRTKQANAFFFEPAVTRVTISRRFLGDMVSRVFDGSAKDVLLTLFDASEIDADELQEIRRYINRKAREQSP